MEKKEKTYLMLGGTFLPAFVGMGLHLAYHKRFGLKISDLLIFAGLSAIGGYMTAKIIQKNENNVQVKQAATNI